MYDPVYFPPPYYPAAYYPSGTGEAPDVVYCYLPADYFPQAYFPCESEAGPAEPTEVDVVFICRVQLGVIFGLAVSPETIRGQVAVIHVPRTEAQIYITQHAELP